MNRILFALLLTATAWSAPATGEVADPGPPASNDSVVVTGIYVRLGDLFRNAGPRADDVVVYAPKPGQQFVLDSHWLYRVARKFSLDWRPNSRLKRSIVRRDSQIIDRRDLEARLLEELIDQEGMDHDNMVQIAGRGFRLHVPVDAATEVAVRQLAYDPRSRHFSAIVTAPPDHPESVTVRVSGRVYDVTRVPVLTAHKAANDVITANDLTWTPLRTDRMHRHIIVDADRLVGMAPLRALLPGRAIRTKDVRRPVLVAKGSLVTLIIRRPGMLLTARGKALEDGGRGSTIRINNIQSNQIVEATVTGAGKATVLALDQVALIKE